MPGGRRGEVDAAVARTVRIGQIVPSSNVTMEIEVPAMLRARESVAPERFTFHSSRMRMRHVTPDELAAMDDQSLRCADEIADAAVDAVGYACLVAIMARGAGYHRQAEARIGERLATRGLPARVVTSAGALVLGLGRLGARRISLVAPYARPLTQRVIDYLENEGIEVLDSISLEVTDNLEVARLDPSRLPDIARRLDVGRADAVVLSACVQMPSLDAIEPAQALLGRPVLSSAVATTYALLDALGLPRLAPGGGELLSGRY